MRLLLLNGYGIRFNVEKARLYIKNGKSLENINNEESKHLNNEESKHLNNENIEYVFQPKRINIDNIVIYGRSGDISIEAIRWLIKHNVAITILDWNGKLLTTMLPKESVQVKTKFAQYASFRDKKLRLEIAKEIIRGKVQRSKAVLEWLKSRYPETNYDFSVEEQRLEEAKNIPELIRAEARIAKQYWAEIVKIIPKKLEFGGRNTIDRPFGAGDFVNCMLNYGYAILEAECLRAINASGLDVHVGFLHEMQLGKNSLAYDLQEPFRFLIDMAVISAIEKGKIENKDFIRTENYNLRLRSSGAKKLIEEINLWFNKRVNFKGKLCTWSNVLITQTTDLAHYLVGDKSEINFEKPFFEIERTDTEEIRRLISEMPYTVWKKMGYSKGTLHPLKQKVKEGKAFNLSMQVKERLLEL